MVNLVLHQKRGTNIVEVVPKPLDVSSRGFLSCSNDGDVEWFPQEALREDGVIHEGRIIGTNIHCDGERVGLGRHPMYSYKFDIAVSENTLTTAFHIGDGNYGFSFGNGTGNGFVPEIIGVGASEKDVALYLIGRAGNKKPSNIPLVVIDGRNCYHKELTNRPIFGISGGVYGEFKVLVDQEGTVFANDFTTGEVTMNELVNIIVDQEKQVSELRRRLTRLEALLNL